MTVRAVPLEFRPAAFGRRMPKRLPARDPEPPEPPGGVFPPWVRTDAERRRFRLALGIARELMGEEDGPTVWQMTRCIYMADDLPAD